MGQLRIIAGCWRGRKIVVAAPTKQAPATKKDLSPLAFRPTTDRARTTLFNWLQHFGVLQQNPATLDLYAGSGILGLEALSRGAGAVTFVEKHAPLMQALSAQIEHLWASTPVAECPSLRPNMVVADANVWMQQEAKLGRKWALILCDPPYETTDYPRLLAQLRPLLMPEGWLYFEASRDLVKDAEAAGFVVQRAKAIAHSWLHLLTPEG